MGDEIKFYNQDAAIRIIDARCGCELWREVVECSLCSVGAWNSTDNSIAAESLTIPARCALRFGRAARGPPHRGRDGKVRGSGAPASLPTGPGRAVGRRQG